MSNILENYTTAVIHQPYFLPWMGYFSKLVYADKFIVLDSVYFTKRKWIDRVQIINTQGVPMWIGLPIGQHFNEPCNEIHFSDKKAIDKIIKSLYSSYSKARHFKDSILYIEAILLESFASSDLLSEINISIIKRIISFLQLKMPEIILSSQFQEVDDTTNRVISLCQKTKSNALISGIEGLQTHDLTKIRESGIDVFLQDYYNKHPVYYQTRRKQLGFAKGLSIIDCILNEGVITTKALLTDRKNEPIIYNSII